MALALKGLDPPTQRKLALPSCDSHLGRAQECQLVTHGQTFLRLSGSFFFFLWYWEWNPASYEDKQEVYS
jgi:hypothetical protein